MSISMRAAAIALAAGCAAPALAQTSVQQPLHVVIVRPHATARGPQWGGVLYPEIAAVYPVPAAPAAGPAVIIVMAQAAPPPPVAKPPCRETQHGVVIERGSDCR